MALSRGSLLLNVRKKVNNAGGRIGKISGQEKNIITCNLARMNMLLHGVKDTEFEIYHGDMANWNVHGRTAHMRQMVAQRIRKLFLTCR